MLDVMFLYALFAVTFRLALLLWYGRTGGMSRLPDDVSVTIWKLGRTVCMYSMVQRREKERRKTRDIWTRHQPLQQSPCIRSVTYLRHKYTCNSQVEVISSASI